MGIKLSGRARQWGKHDNRMVQFFLPAAGCQGPAAFLYPARLALYGVGLAIIWVCIMTAAYAEGAGIKDAGGEGARALSIQEIVTPRGLSVWLVEDHSLPVISMNFAFAGGSTQDPPGKEGLAYLMSGTMDEGAGDMDAQAFQARLDALSMRLYFDSGRDHFFGTMQTLAANTADAFDMLRLALAAPRFDADAVDRIRAQIVAGLRSREKDPEYIASRTFFQAAFGDHPYGAPTRGTIESMEALDSADLRALHRNLMTGHDLGIAVVGAISADDLAPLVDLAFADLPPRGTLRPVPDITPQGGFYMPVDYDVPQTVIVLGMPGPVIRDASFFPTLLMTHILGGRGFSSWLYQSVREERGLAYSVGLSLVGWHHAGLILGSTATRTDQAGLAVSVFLGQLQKMAREGPDAKSLELARDFLIGSYILRFDSSEDIAGQLLGIQLNGFGADYVTRRAEILAGISAGDVRQAAADFLENVQPGIVSVGRQALDIAQISSLPGDDAGGGDDAGASDGARAGQ